MIEYIGDYLGGEYKRGFYHPGIRLKNLTTRGKFYRFLGNKLLKKIRLHREDKNRIFVNLNLDKYKNQLLPPGTRLTKVIELEEDLLEKYVVCLTKIEHYEYLAKKKGLMF